MQENITWSVVPDYLKRFINDDYTNANRDVDDEVREIARALSTSKVAKTTEGYRSKMDSFIKGGAKLAGQTDVNIVGEYQIGPRPSEKEIPAIVNRAKGERLIAEAIRDGVEKSLKDLNFTFSEDGRYENSDQAKWAVEVESMSSKGPYDNGSDRKAFEVEEDNLTDAYTECVIGKTDLAVLIAGFERRRNEYSPHLNKSKRFDPDSWLSFVEKHGLKTTFRGGFNAAGNSLLNQSQLEYAKLCLSRVPDCIVHSIKRHNFQKMLWVQDVIMLPSRHAKSALLQAARAAILQKYVDGKDGKAYKVLNRSTADVDGVVKYTRPMTVDEFIAYINHDLFVVKRLMPSQCVSEMMRVVGNLQRDQGSPFEYYWTPYGVQQHRLTLADERKKQKYRMVTPYPAIYQSWLGIATEEIMDVAPSTEGRIGLSHEAENNVRMSKYITESFQHGCYNEPFDATRFDASQIDQLHNLWSLMASSLYDDPWAKEVLGLCGHMSMNKYLIMAKPIYGAGDIWDKFERYPLTRIKGNTEFTYRELIKTSGDPQVKRKLQQAIDTDLRNDYEAVLVKITRSWEPSGIFTTNISESDVGLAVWRNYVPYKLARHPLTQSVLGMPQFLDEGVKTNLFRANTSGDDVTAEMPIKLLAAVGRDALIHAISEIVGTINWTINTKKYSIVTYKVVYEGQEVYLPFVEFLQRLYDQDPSKTEYKGRGKVMRCIPNIGYTERNSDLHPLMQYSGVSGRIDSVLTGDERDSKFMASVLAYAGASLQMKAKRANFHPGRSKWAYASMQAHDGIYDSSCELVRSSLMGLDQYFGLVKSYGDELVSNLTRYTIESSPIKAVDMVQALSRELETKAPHKRNMLAPIYNSLTEEERVYFFGDVAVGESTYQPQSSSVLQQLEKMNVQIKPQRLPDALGK